MRTGDKILKILRVLPAACLILIASGRELPGYPVMRDEGAKIPEIPAPGQVIMPAVGAPVVDGTHDEATALYYDGKYEASLELFRALVVRYPDDASIRSDLVRLLAETGAYPEALPHLEKLAADDPGNARIKGELLKTFFLSGTGGSGNAQPEPEPADAESMLWAALIRYELGDTVAALGFLETALELSPFFPLAWYLRGEILLSNGDFKTAEEAFTAALKQEPNLTMAFLPLARAGIGLGNYGSAYGLLQRAEASLPWNGLIRAAREELAAAHPELLVAHEERKKLERTISIPPSVISSAVPADGIPSVRIGLAEKLAEVHLKAGGDFLLSPLSGTSARASGTKGDILLVTVTSGGTEARLEDGRIIASDPSGLLLEYPDPGSTTILFDLEYGSGYFFAGFEDRSYRGILRFENRTEGMTIVNTLNVEEYLYSILPSEMPSDWPPAALEAQAIAARTYTLLGLGRYASRGFDLLASVSSAAYQGAGRERKSTTAAIDATRGRVITWNGNLVNAVYSANSGGYTESSESVWSFMSPLDPVADLLVPVREKPLGPDDLALWLETRPHTFSSHPSYSGRSAYRWKLPVSSEEMSSRLGADIGRIERIVTRGRGISGRVEKVDVYGTGGMTSVRWDAIRSKLGGLRSNLFIVEPKLGRDGFPEYFLFTGGGWGHGVGMDQSGAAGMASLGFSAEEIIRHYYPGTGQTDRY